MVRLVRSLDEIREELRNLAFEGQSQTLGELLQAKRWFDCKLLWAFWKSYQEHLNGKNCKFRFGPWNLKIPLICYCAIMRWNICQQALCGRLLGPCHNTARGRVWKGFLCPTSKYDKSNSKESKTVFKSFRGGCLSSTFSFEAAVHTAHSIFFKQSLILFLRCFWSKTLVEGQVWIFWQSTSTRPTLLRARTTWL